MSNTKAEKVDATALHDEQTSAAADSLRAVLKDPTFRGGNTQRDMDALREKLEGIAKGLDEQGKTPEQIAEMRAENGEPDPNKSSAELLRETIDNDPDASRNLEGKNVSSPGTQLDSKDTKVPMGEPAVKAQASTVDRDKAEVAKKTGDDASPARSLPKSKASPDCVKSLNSLGRLHGRPFFSCLSTN
jgi:hypothetical protein